ncbi:hypothetical protein [Achromobacter mucicolens]|uniref:hypothetical protein n=1 Tax=Achromobacter mucicolens TaxID=1389922 RepID=UPI003976D7A7
MTPITPAPPIDWNRVFLTLRSEGYTLHDVAAYTRIPRGTMMGWMRGAEPRHQDGETIIKFWTEATQQPREALPERSPVAFASRLAEARV